MSWKNNYQTTRNATWVYYLIAAVFFFMAVRSFPTPHSPDPSMFGFIFWAAAATGTAFGAGRNKRAAKRKAAKNLDVARG